MRYAFIVLFALSVFLFGCNVLSDNVSTGGIPSPTPFQPGSDNASDSLYAGAAPTPLSLPTLTPTPPTPTPVVILPEYLPAGVGVPVVVLPPAINPLTGLPPSDPSLLERRPMAIKVANYPRYIRPQSGLTLADQVFEYYIEEGLTRFIAIFYGNDSEWVGPVRSGRFFDEHIARMYQAYLVFKFADARVLSYFRGTDLADFLVVPSNGACPPFRIMETRQIEVYNNSYFNTLLWDECVNENDLRNDRPTLRPMLFSDGVQLPNSLPAERIFTYYSLDSYHYWQYDANRGEYLRYQETRDMRNGKAESYELLVDAVTGDVVHASNIVVLFAYHTFSNPYDEDDEVYHIDLTGSGEAYIFRNGVGITGKWYRINKNQPLLLTDAFGSAVYLRPGITFYEVIGSYSYASQGEGEWFFHHETP
ncbi:MAG TPA: DUF3048 domain-containing protein [Anaerolineales bacterium]|nr:DUF3048 domain-containing protein [Anaerolineales bacterium]